MTFGRAGIPSIRASESHPSTDYHRPTEQRLILNHTEGWELFKIFIVNTTLTFLTLGIYRFWAKTRLRRYLWGNVEILGDRLEYTGTGKELFLGFLVVFFVILLPLFGGIAALQAIVAVEDEALSALLTVVQAVLIVFLMQVAFFRARRYRLSRTSWRGIYGGQTGSAVLYALMAFGCILLTGLTVGLAWPACSVWLKRYEMAHTWIGDEQPEFSPLTKKLYPPFLITWGIALACYGGFTVINSSTMEIIQEALLLEEPDSVLLMQKTGLMFLSFLVFVPLVLAMLWYRGKSLSHFVSVTKFHGYALGSTISGFGFMWLVFSNLLLTLVTLGFGVPWTYKRILTFVQEHTSLVGNGDFGSLWQSVQERPTRGEGLADAFDVGAI